ncbi:MAG: hypothetical protein U0802_17290 [Candidatus Binatia bacterium]
MPVAARRQGATGADFGGVGQGVAELIGEEVAHEDEQPAAMVARLQVGEGVQRQAGDAARPLPKRSTWRGRSRAARRPTTLFRFRCTILPFARAQQLG